MEVSVLGFPVSFMWGSVLALSRRGGSGPRVVLGLNIIGSLWEELRGTVGWAPMEAVSNHLVNSSHRFGVGVLTLQGLYKLSWQLFSMVCVGGGGVANAL